MAHAALRTSSGRRTWQCVSFPVGPAVSRRTLRWLQPRRGGHTAKRRPTGPIHWEQTASLTVPIESGRISDTQKAPVNVFWMIVLTVSGGYFMLRGLGRRNEAVKGVLVVRCNSGYRTAQ